MPLVREILKERPKWLHLVGSHGRTMLWEACHRGKLPMVKYLVRRKANIDACGTHYTPYFVEISCYCIARYKGHDDVADYLLSKQAQLNIHTAAFLGDLESLQKELKRDISLLDDGHPQYIMSKELDEGLGYGLAPAHWATPLCYALRGGDLRTMDFLIQQGARIKGLERWLFIAADDNPDAVRLLLEHGASPTHAPHVSPDQGELYDLVKTHGGQTAGTSELSEELVYVCRGDRGGSLAEVKRLIELGAMIDHQDAKGKTALHRAAKAGFVETVKLLLELGARHDLSDAQGETALFDGLRSTIKDGKARRSTIRTLIKAGASPDHVNSKGQTAWDIARQTKRGDGPSIIRLMRRS